MKPLPACTEVENPDFRYSSFWFPGREPDDFEPKVQAERKEMLAEEEKRETDIHRRLRGAR
ncbi:hypothetical protein ACFQV2_23520 [Actinokineospora soli]|uniref:Uncharacterized protein n=1 Tax=Actinokineospora soli TaxID=1048753 RepID=A0ABW2TS51_9PSEU